MADDPYEALDERFTAAGLGAPFAGGSYFAGEPPGNTPLPYLVMTPLGEAKDAETNRRRYENCGVQFAVAAATFRQARQLVRALTAGLTRGPMAAGGGDVLHLVPGGRNFLPEQGFWRATQDFEMKVSSALPSR
jgi:hypothetical protein